MIIKTYSATELAKVAVEAAVDGACSDVWLRQNIEQDTKDASEDGAKEFNFWTADEVHFVQAGTPSIDELEDDFDALWAEHENDGLSDSERLAQLEQDNADMQAALLELGDLVGGEE